MDQHHVEYITEEASAVRTRGITANTRKWLLLADLSGCFFFSWSPRLLTRLGPLMSESMCGCGCSIISSLMKRLGCAVCCSDLFSSHTSEQLQWLAAGCRPQPKVTPTRSHLCPLLNGALLDYSKKPRVMCCAENIWSDFGKSHMQNSYFISNVCFGMVRFTTSHISSLWSHSVKCKWTYLPYK